MAVAGVAEVEDIQMGTMTIQITLLVGIQEGIQEVETTLQPIPAGMIIQGLDDAV